MTKVLIKKLLLTIEKIFSISILFTMFSIQVSATNHYVDKNVSSGGNGLSWSTAWNSFSAINWNSIHAGDVIYISGGSDSTIYNQSLEIERSDVTITKGIGIGHNGRVIIEAPSYQVGSGIIINERSRIAIIDIEIRNFNKGIEIDSRIPNGVDSIKIQNCILINGERSIETDGRSDTTGNNCKNIWVLNNYIEYLPNGNLNSNQTDGLSIYYTRNFFFIGNTIINRNVDPDDTHSDFVQGAFNTNQYYFNNFFFIGNTLVVGQNGVQIGGNSAGDFYFANNVLNMGTYTQQSAFWAELFPRQWGNMHITNNTFIGGIPRFLHLGNNPNAVIKNNLFWATGTYNFSDYGKNSFIFVEPEDGSVANFSIEYNNFYWRMTDNVFLEGNDAFPRPPSNGWLQYPNNKPSMVNFDPAPINYQINIYSTNPQDYVLTNESLREIDAAETLMEINFPTSLSAPYWFKAWDYIKKDFNGVSRNTSWDVGAFECGSDSLSYIRVNGGWNYISIPKHNSNMSIEYLLPSAISSVYSFNGNNYEAVDFLENGRGYIVKFASIQNIIIEGNTISDPIPVKAGWNFIGPFDGNISVSQIITIPNGIISSAIFEFIDNHFTPVSVLRTGKGYWVKSFQNGMLYFP